MTSFTNSLDFRPLSEWSEVGEEPSPEKEVDFALHLALAFMLDSLFENGSVLINPVRYEFLIQLINGDILNIADKFEAAETREGWVLRLIK